MTIILANGASYDFKERVVLRRLSLEMRVDVGKRQQRRGFSVWSARSHVLCSADTGELEA